jgi:hypothetical protein
MTYVCLYLKWMDSQAFTQCCIRDYFEPGNNGSLSLSSRAVREDVSGA